MKTLQPLLALVVSCTLCAGLAAAQPASPLPLENDTPIPDVRVIIDISGSMKQNDPLNLRRPALELLVQLFPEGAKAGVWTFGQWVNMLVPHKPVTSAWRQNALGKAQKINSVALHTNIEQALIKATDDIEFLKPGYKTSLILLTDGMVDISKSPKENRKARQRIIDEIIPRLRDAGMTVHTVALSENADRELMERLAIETNGLAAVAQSADDLTQIFLQAFDAAIPAEQVPLEGNTFLVDSSIEEFTALVFRQAGSEDVVLIAPDGKQYTQANDRNDEDLRWFSKENYDLITVNRPYEGEWSLIADLEPSSRVTVVSNLSLQVTPLAKSAFVGSEKYLSAALKEQGKTIVNPALLDLVDMSVEITRRDTNEQSMIPLSQEPIPSDGVYSTTLEMLQKTGVYDVVVKANGKTFQRQHRQMLEVRESFSVSVSSTEDNPPSHLIKLFAVNPAIDTNNAKVVARIDFPDGSNDMELLSTNSVRNWELPITGIEQSGMLTVSLKVNGQYQDGRAFNYIADPVVIEHKVAGVPFNTPPPAAKPEPEAKQPPEPEVQPSMEEESPVEESEGMDWTKIALYAGLAIGNLLVLFLAYYVYKMVTSKSNSGVLDQDDEVEPEVSPEAEEPIAAASESSEPEPKTGPKSDEEIEELDTETFDSADEVDEVDLDLEDTELDDVDLEDTELDDVDLSNESEDDEELGDILDLPDDAIDIDPTADDDAK